MLVIQGSPRFGVTERPVVLSRLVEGSSGPDGVSVFCSQFVREEGNPSWPVFGNSPEIATPCD